MWFWLTSKIHENVVLILFVIVLGLLFFPDATTGAAGNAVGAIEPASDLAIYTSKGIFKITSGIYDAMFSQ